MKPRSSSTKSSPPRTTTSPNTSARRTRKKPPPTSNAPPNSPRATTLANAPPTWQRRPRPASASELDRRTQALITRLVPFRESEPTENKAGLRGALLDSERPLSIHDPCGLEQDFEEFV